jgi:hypothetical protein
LLMPLSPIRFFGPAEPPPPGLPSCCSSSSHSS